MEFYDVVAEVIKLLEREGRVSYRALKLQLKLDDDYIEGLKDELIYAKKLATDEDNRVLVWGRDTDFDVKPTPAPSTLEAIPSPTTTSEPEPLSYTPSYLAEKILTSKSGLEGERKVVTVLFADIKDSTELIRDLDPEDAQKLLDPAIHIMMEAVHRFEGTVNQVLGDGVMSIFGAPIAHEDHSARACYAALAMQAAMHDYTEDVRRNQGLELRIRVGLNSGEVVVRTITSDLHMDYSAVGQTTHLAARMEQLANPGSIRLSSSTLRLVEGLVQVNGLGPIPVKGMSEPVEVYELTGASTVRRRLQAAVARGLTKFIGRNVEIETLNQALEQAGSGHGQIVAAVGEAGVGKSRLTYEFVHSHRTQGWLVLESASVSYGKATPYFPVIDLIKRYTHVEEGDDARTIRAKVTGHILTLDETLQETIPALLSLLDALPEDSPFLELDPPQRRQRTLDGLKRIFLRESQVQPLILVFEDLHWIDSETQALLNSLIESLPTAQLLLLVNYRPEYNHGWGSKTYYTQLRLDPLPPESADALLEALLGDDSSLEPLKRLLIERTEGNPFFLEESVRTLVETQVLAGEPVAYSLVQALPSIQVPATVQAILAARIDRLSQGEKSLLQTASVIGNEIPLLLLQAIAEIPEDALKRGLTHLQATGFLDETNLFPERVYAFKHALTQNVAYQSLLMGTRQQHHAQIAHALETHFSEAVEIQPELLAHHYTEAGFNQQAVTYWQQAGRRAIMRSANVEAVSHLTQALVLLESLPETSERAQRELALQIALGSALIATKGQSDSDVQHAYARARQLCQHIEQSPQLSPVQHGLWRLYYVRAELQTARALAEEALTLAQQAEDPVLFMAAHHALGSTLLVLGELPLARTHLEQGLALYNPEQHIGYALRYGLDAGTLFLSYTAWALWLLGYPDQALQRSQEALTLARERAHPISLARAHYFAAMLHQLRRESQAAHELAQTAIALCAQQMFTLYLAWGTILESWVLGTRGQGEEAIAQIQQGLVTTQTLGAELIRPYSLGLQSEVYRHIGQPSEWLTTLDEALSLIANTGERWYEAELIRLKGELLLQQSFDNTTEAESCFYKALEVSQSQKAKSWELRAAMSFARLWQSQDKRQEAYDLLSPVYNWFTEGFDTADLIDAKALLDELSEGR